MSISSCRFLCRRHSIHPGQLTHNHGFVQLVFTHSFYLVQRILALCCRMNGSISRVFVSQSQLSFDLSQFRCWINCPRCALETGTSAFLFRYMYPPIYLRSCDCRNGPEQLNAEIRYFSPWFRRIHYSGMGQGTLTPADCQLIAQSPPRPREDRCPATRLLTPASAAPKVIPHAVAPGKPTSCVTLTGIVPFFAAVPLHAV